VYSVERKVGVILAVFTGNVGLGFAGESEWWKIMTAGPFALCVKRLVKLTPG